MSEHILAFDLGTGGSKASLHDAAGNCLATAFMSYETAHPQESWREQRPEDWWLAVVSGARQLLAAAQVDPKTVVGIGLSGHSLGVVPVDKRGRLLREATPIWSDSRPGPRQMDAFFSQIDEAAWYLATGNGFPPPLYPVFKLLWLKDHEPEVLRDAHRILGSKDYINFRLTGRMATDPSYASGSGVYNLRAGGYSPELLAASGLPDDVFPEIVPSTQVLDGLSPQAAAALGLPAGVPVVAGGVDNACMALGALAFKEGDTYNSLGSSSWTAVASGRPLLDAKTRPYVFAHVVPGMFVSATAIFAAGSCLRWARDCFARDLVAQAAATGRDVYELMAELAAQSPPGARGLLFNPSLAGGTRLDANPEIRGAFLGLDLKHSQADLLRAVMEGVALGLRVALDALRDIAPIGPEMVVVGGGSKSALWRGILADVFGMRIVKTNVDQQAAALGAAALAAVGVGLWNNFEPMVDCHRCTSTIDPDPVRAKLYEQLLPVFAEAANDLARHGQRLSQAMT